MNAIDTTYFRYGVDAQYKVNDNISLQAEYIAGTDKDSNTGAITINSSGYYGQIAYDFDNKNKAVVMYDSYRTTGTESLNTLTAGYIYQMNNNLKLKLFGKNKSGDVKGNEFIFETTISF